MTIGMSRPMVTKMVAGPTSMAAVESRPPRLSRAASDTRLSAVADTVMTSPRTCSGGLELLVPEVLELTLALGQELEVGMDDQLFLLGREADARPQLRRHFGGADHGVVAHVCGEAFLNRGLECRVEEGVGAVLVGGVLGDSEARDVADDAFL